MSAMTQPALLWLLFSLSAVSRAGPPGLAGLVADPVAVGPEGLSGATPGDGPEAPETVSLAVADISVELGVRCVAATV